MKILVTGAKGFVGKNLCENLKNIRDGKDRTRPNITVDDIFEYDIDTAPELLDEYCAKADFVFNLAGVNRPQSPEEFMQGNFGFASTLLDTLKKHGNKCPVMLSSSIQATCIGRYDSDYGRSKKAGEDLFFDYAEQTGAKVLVYRFPNLFGKWCRPNYNSAVATFCNNIANDLPITVSDPSVRLELLYIDDLVNGMLDLSKIQSGVRVPDKQLFCLTEIVKSTLIRYEKLVIQESYKIDFIFDDEPAIIFPDEYTELMNEFKFKEAFDFVWAKVQAANKKIDDKKPWALAKENRLDELDDVMNVYHNWEE